MNESRCVWAALGLTVVSGCSSGTGVGLPSAAKSGAASDSGTASAGDGAASDSGTASAGDGAASDSGTASAGDGGAGTDAGTEQAICDGDGADGGIGTATSCATRGPGLSSCGPSCNENCCTSLEVEGGTYDRTYTNSGTGATGLADPASVSGFRLDKYLVTVGRFRQYVNYATSSAGAPPANGSGIHTHLNGGQGLANSGSPGVYETGWDATDWNTYIATGPGAASTWDTNLACEAGYNSWTSAASTQENLPINCVNWYESYAFCIWDGAFLPSEAEWEYVAAGGIQQREYPWGSTDPGIGNQYAIYNGYYTADPTGIAPVGTATLGAGYWGQLDMAGEVLEWNLDAYAMDYVDPSTNAAYLSAPTSRVNRGGNVSSVEAFLLPPLRYFNDPTYRAYGLGVRCARTP
jgi:formylglycine-generating enzyme required for sulfatase activity